jgi:hypothetical protein
VADNLRVIQIIVVKEAEQLTTTLLYAEIMVSVHADVARATHVSNASVCLGDLATELLSLILGTVIAY